MTTVTAWHTRLETTTSVMMDGLHVRTPKEIYSKWHVCISKGEWLHIIDFICSESEIWHAADSSVEIVKFYTTQNLLWRMMDCEDQIFGERTQCVINPLCTFYFTCLSSLSRNGHGKCALSSMISTSFYSKPHSHERKRSCNDNLTPSDTCALQHCCSLYHLVGWAGTCELGAKASSERLPKKCLAEKNISLLLDESPR